MDFNEIMGKIKEINSDQIYKYFKGELIRIIRNVDKDVYDTFMSDKPRDSDFSFYNGHIETLKEFAVKFISYIISQITDYKFNTTVNSTLATLQEWYTNNEKDLGLLMFKKFLIEVKNFSVYFNNADAWAKVIEDTITSKEFTTGLQIEQLSRDTTLLYNLLFTLKLLDSSGQRYKRVISLYSQIEVISDAVLKIDCYEWFYIFKQQGEVSLISQNFYNYVITAIKTVETKKTKDLHSDIIHVTDTYGRKVVEWLNNENGPKAYRVRTNNNPSNVIQSKESFIGDLFGCVVKGTQILLSDGSSKSIESISEWDKVVSEGGNVSICSDELVYNEKLTTLYSINNDVPFMSLDHAVKTDLGWCSLNPELSNEINKNYNVKKLKVGDKVYKIDSYNDGVATYKKEVVEKINMKEFSKGEIEAYDIHFREGYMSYHCNGYLCLLNYPEITGKTVDQNINNNLTEEEKLLLIKIIKDNLSIFEKVFGRQSMDYLNLY